MQEYARNNLPEGGWETVYRTDEYRALRVEGEFKVRTDNGTVFCEDGYVVVDNAGTANAVPVNVFNALYETEGQGVTDPVSADETADEPDEPPTDDENTLTTPVGLTTSSGLS